MTQLLLVESDLHLVKQLRPMIAKCAFDCHLMAEVSSLAKAEAFFSKKTPPDALLLGAEDAENTCFDWLDGLPQPMPAIVYARNQNLAARAFQSNVLDFLLTPICPLALGRALNKLRQACLHERLSQQIQLLFQAAQPWCADKLVLHLLDGIHILPLAEVIRLESDGCYTTFFTSRNERIVTTKSIGEFDYLTAGSQFFRVHQSHIVNLHFVRRVLRNEGGFAVLDCGSKVPIARRRKEEFLKVISG